MSLSQREIHRFGPAAFKLPTGGLLKQPHRNLPPAPADHTERERIHGEQYVDPLFACQSQPTGTYQVALAAAIGFDHQPAEVFYAECDRKPKLTKRLRDTMAQLQSAGIGVKRIGFDVESSAREVESSAGSILPAIANHRGGELP